MNWQHGGQSETFLGAGGYRVRLPEAPRPAKLPGDATAGEALMAYLRAQRDRLHEAERALRADEPDGAFDLRTAVRRTRAALRTYQSLMTEAELVTGLIEELKWLGREVSPVRDAQVAQERISAGLDQLDAELHKGPVAARVGRYFAEVQADARAALIDALDSPRWARLRSEVERVNERPSLTGQAARPASTELLTHLRSTARGLVEQVAYGDSSDAGMHAIRKVCRHLRESAQVAWPVIGKPAKRFDRRLEKLRRVLGEHQDSVVSRRALTELVAEAESAGENVFTYGLLYGSEWTLADEVRARVPRYWRKAWRAEYLDWLDPDLVRTQQQTSRSDHHSPADSAVHADPSTVDV